MKDIGIELSDLINDNIEGKLYFRDEMAHKQETFYWEIEQPTHDINNTTKLNLRDA